MTQKDRREISESLQRIESMLDAARRLMGDLPTGSLWDRGAFIRELPERLEGEHEPAIVEYLADIVFYRPWADTRERA